jgi:hypothetical protein
MMALGNEFSVCNFLCYFLHQVSEESEMIVHVKSEQFWFIYSLCRKESLEDGLAHGKNHASM